MSPGDEILNAARELAEGLDAFLDAGAARLEELSDLCVSSLLAGGKLLLFGNGGSAAQAQHLASELVHRLEKDRSALAALALGTDAAVSTAIANDTSFSRVFAREIEALGRPPDVALALSTSGASASVVEGLRAARALGLRTGALLGPAGGAARELVDVAVLVPARGTARIQEVQLFAGHLLCRLVEQGLRHR